MNKRKKKAFSILEFIISFAISMTIASFLFILILMCVKDNQKENKSYVNYVYLKQAVDIIDREISTGRFMVEVKNNSIILKENKINNPIEKEITKNKENRVVSIVKINNSIQTSNNIIKNVEEFYVEQKGDLIFIKIVLKEGEIIEKCLPMIKT
ncbi:hypothetical protein [Clostridium algidicarnis]|uniref:Prepilin-type N-terminal cleavage/methylation domain-containing protein n=2 Tax=Clostridium algidicarnis TaxID=37659 RepID=A0A2S6G1G4_9CLOT|nr:hypothetical protein [Clostridium algidicarnis]MBB6631263.1 hypothetical protein [Clostridium algidicarnis]MBU3193825.1 hypothetical protein [Clostridium algidicarnis]MBU3203294.1 hypothetical protein [Clostridium algidicarnis]MBU3205411.1 hypothetical protein [Clostridium algidicarnis]MBU3211448.1 hypothetical protein [Clostridium algidicarnis]